MSVHKHAFTDDYCVLGENRFWLKFLFRLDCKVLTIFWQWQYADGAWLNNIAEKMSLSLGAFTCRSKTRCCCAVWSIWKSPVWFQSCLYKIMFQEGVEAWWSNKDQRQTCICCSSFHRASSAETCQMWRTFRWSSCCTRRSIKASEEGTNESSVLLLSFCVAFTFENWLVQYLEGLLLFLDWEVLRGSLFTCVEVCQGLVKN